MNQTTIIADAFSITCNAQEQGGRLSFLIQDGCIRDISTDAGTFKSANPDALVIDGRRMLVIPGFVNAHFHPERLLFQDLFYQTPFSLWRQDSRYQERMTRLGAADAQSDLLTVFGLSAIHNIRSGITTACLTLPPVESEVLASLKSPETLGGLRPVIVIRTWEQIAEARRLASTSGIFLSLGEEAELTVYSIDSMTRAAKELGVTLSAHLGERKEEIDALRRSFRKGILTILRDFGLLTPSLHLVHMNHGNAEDVRLGVEQGVTFVLCPRSTILKRTGYPLLRHIGNAPLRVCIGTDWEEPDMFREMQFLSQLSMLFSGFPSFAPLELVHMATINGAASLGKANEIGSLERGKKADFVILNLSPVHLEYLNDNPSARDLASLLVRNLSTADIRTVMVDGKDVFSNGICTHMDEESTVARFRRVFASMPGILSDSESPVTRAKIIPFVGPSAGRGPDLEGFEEGFAVMKPQKSSVAPTSGSLSMTPAAVATNEDQSKARIPTGPVIPIAAPRDSEEKEETSTSVSSRVHEIQKPELSKNVRKVFGDDEESIPE